ncbi:chitinase [Brucella pituitosa]|uniref:chitinase n=1 Tax=Brucella pituitosa TaxID=571256 RepID=A0ABS3K5V0_9HYPH|nr:glycosyl hydrolase family 18 protein [Brucella pituitosa]MBO1042282.1 chitinase [Brucella pituitosa]
MPSLESYINSSVSHHIKDAASSIPDFRNKKVVMGFWHNWPAEVGQGYRQGLFKEMALTDVPEEYNIIAVAFMKGSGVPTFKPYKYSDEEFRRQISALNEQGRAVLISLGGADAHIELYAGQENELATEIIRLVETYGFDGLDIDLEQSAILAADNMMVISSALKSVKDYYRSRGQDFIISMAPEFPYLVEDGAYAGYIRELDGYYNFIAPQFYNQGGAGVWVDELNAWIAQNNEARKEDFLYYLTDSLVRGTRGYLKIPHDKFVIGLPSNQDAAANGYIINPDHLTRAVNRLEKSGTPIKGIMTWSVNWDAGVDRVGTPYNWEFVTRYGSIFGDGTVPDIPDNIPEPPRNIRAIAQSHNSITLQWDAGANVGNYAVHRDGIEIAKCRTETYTDDGLTPGRIYRYYVTTTSVSGLTSQPSPEVTASTDKEPATSDQWRTDKWFDRDNTVIWQNAKYACRQEHTSNKWWPPHLATSLWSQA